VDGTENAREPWINVVRTNKPKTLIGLSQKACGGHRSFPFLLSQTPAPPADRRLLTHQMAQKRNVVSPALPPSGTASRKVRLWGVGERRMEKAKAML
jgi:hypothetical protein